MAAASSASSSKRRYGDVSTSSSSSSSGSSAPVGGDGGGERERKVRRKEIVSLLEMEPIRQLDLPIPNDHLRSYIQASLVTQVNPAPSTPIGNPDRIGFVPASDRKMCLPFDIGAERKTPVVSYPTLKQCLLTLPSDEGKLPEALERMIGSYFLHHQMDQVGKSDDEAIRLELPIVQRDVAESKDVLAYYLTGRQDVALALLRMGYGIGDLYELLQHLMHKRMMFVDETDYKIYSLIVHNPTWLAGVSAEMRAHLWMWGVRNLLSLFEGKQINERQVIQQVDLLNKVFPLDESDLARGVEDVSFFLSHYTNNVLAQMIFERMIQSLLSPTSSSTSVTDGNVRQRGEVLIWLIRYAQGSCALGTFGKPNVRILIDTILNLPQIQSVPAIIELKLEYELDRLWKLLNDPDEEKNWPQIQADIEQLIVQRVGKCFLPRGDTKVDLQKRIVRPTVRDYNRIRSMRQYLDLLQAQTNFLLVESTEDDIKVLNELLDGLNLDHIDSRELVGQLISNCRSSDPRVAVGCSGIASMLNDQYSLSQAIIADEDDDQDDYEDEDQEDRGDE